MKKFLLLIPLSTLFLVSCKQGEITDFFLFIEERGYLFEGTLIKKFEPVDERLLGGYLYETLPVIISKKDKDTYSINFLATDLNSVDRTVDAKMTRIGTTNFLNLDMGGQYAIVKVDLNYDNEFTMNLVRGSMQNTFDEEQMRLFLTMHPEEESYTPRDDENAFSQEVYYSVSFNKITVEYAREVQETALYERKENLYRYCLTYHSFESLKQKYPLPELYVLAEESLLKECKTIEDYQEFIGYFPTSKFVKEAQIQIAKLREDERQKALIEEDRLAFAYAKETNTFVGYEGFIEGRKTNVYLDSAKAQLTSLANAITRTNLEWNWTNGNCHEGVLLAYYKINYGDTIDFKPWLIRNLPYYSLLNGSAQDKELSVELLGRLWHEANNPNDNLRIYLQKGFLLWSIGNTEAAVETFRSKINQKFSNNELFSDLLKKTYKEYHKLNATLADEKATWKKIKKLD